MLKSIIAFAKYSQNFKYAISLMCEKMFIAVFMLSNKFDVSMQFCHVNRLSWLLIDPYTAGFCRNFDGIRVRIHEKLIINYDLFEFYRRLCWH